MIKEKKSDVGGGKKEAEERTKGKKTERERNIKKEGERRKRKEVAAAIRGGVDRIMLDNFSVSETKEAVKYIAGRTEVESSGGITHDTLVPYAECGVDFISVGALTHHIKGLDMSLKAL